MRKITPLDYNQITNMVDMARSLESVPVSADASALVIISKEITDSLNELIEAFNDHIETCHLEVHVNGEPLDIAKILPGRESLIC
jgi:hypothetical protein